MHIHNKVKKGDVVALALQRSTTYAVGSGRGTKRETFFTLAVVNTASREGEARSLRRRSGTIIETRRKDFRLENVRTISAPMPAQALAAFKKLTWETDEFETADALKDAIRAA